jgi:hypothetical protein
VRDSKPSLGLTPNQASILKDYHMLSHIIKIPLHYRLQSERKVKTMATMKDMWAQMIEKMSRQAIEIGKLRYEKAHFEKTANTWEERAATWQRSRQTAL